MQPLQGKIAWITGAGSGVGQATAKALAQAGAKVALSGRRADALSETRMAVEAAGGEAFVAPCDVGDAAATGAAATAIASTLGPIDIVVNAAGLNVPNRMWRDTNADAWRAVIDANLNGAFHVTHAVLAPMRARGGGVIVHVASWSGRFVTGFTGAAYTAAKHGINALVQHVNIECGRDGVRCVALNPGEINTPILDKRPEPPPPEERARMLQADDCAAAILYAVTQPAHVCVNEILISPSWNRIVQT